LSYQFPTSDKEAQTMNDVHRTFRDQGLVRPTEGRVLGGVIAGLGRRFGIDPWPARLLFTLILLAIPGSQILIYPILWILMPAESAVAVAPSAPTVPASPA
jgi:phage shock protein PspC (stress-responsive transcriptional regulator)